MGEVIHVFIGPKKTGTSWLYKQVFGTLNAKEIRYPVKIGRKYVFNRYVRNKKYLCWPYLLHEPDCLRALIEDMERNDLNPIFYRTTRDSESLAKSMIKFQMKYGLSFKAAEIKVMEELQTIESSYQEFSKKNEIINISIVDPHPTDLVILSSILDRSIPVLEKLLSERIYVTNERSRTNSLFITRIFFRLKPFLPSALQNITKNKNLRGFFLKGRKIS